MKQLETKILKSFLNDACIVQGTPYYHINATGLASLQIYYHNTKMKLQKSNNEMNFINKKNAQRKRFRIRIDEITSFENDDFIENFEVLSKLKEIEDESIGKQKI